MFNIETAEKLDYYVASARNDIYECCHCEPKAWQSRLKLTIHLTFSAVYDIKYKMDNLNIT